ncbi:MAG: hypothetical protein HN368_20475 [Spirochaetales bacterium]|nr:hypothetical protein [Spirochaetales bacterium]
MSKPRGGWLDLFVRYTIEDKSRLLGFMQAPWRITQEKRRQKQIEEIDQVARAILSQV